MTGEGVKILDGNTFVVSIRAADIEASATIRTDHWSAFDSDVTVPGAWQTERKRVSRL